MSRFDGLRTKEAIESSKFAGLRTIPLNNYSFANLSTEETSLPKGDSWPALIGKSALKGVTDIAGLPRLAEEVAAYPRNKLGEFFNMPSLKYDPMLPSGKNIRNRLGKILDVDLEPNPTTDAQRVASHATEFAAGFGPFGLAAKGNLLLKGLNTAKQAGIGAAIGSTSGVMQEMGVDPLVADLGASIAVPSVAAKTKNIFSNFTQKGRDNIIKDGAANILRKDIGEGNIPEVIGRLDYTSPIGVRPTTVELAENSGLSHRARTESPSLPDMHQRNALNDSIMREKIADIAPRSGLNDEIIGETIRNNLYANLEKAKKIRSDTTKPLYDRVESLTDKITLPKTKEYLKNESRYAEGDIKNNIKYITDTLGKDAEILPVQAVSKRKAITDRLSEVKGESSRRVLKNVEESILDDMSHIPEERIAREAYKDLSIPVSAIEDQNLLKKFVEKDKYSNNFILSPEKIPSKILGSSLNDVKALMKQVEGSPETVNSLRSSIIDKLLKSSETSAINAASGKSLEHNLSYNKLNNALSKYKPKLDLIFEKEQVELLEHVRDLLKKRNMVATLGRAAGSNTQSQLTLLELTSLPKGADFMNLVEGVPVLGKPISKMRDRSKAIQDANIRNLVGRALVDPQLSKELLTRPKNAESIDTFLERLPKNLLVSTSLNSREDQ
jgi:hypothetical protein